MKNIEDTFIIEEDSTLDVTQAEIDDVLDIGTSIVYSADYIMDNIINKK